MLEQLYRVRDRVLDNARVEPGDVLLDVGCGDGLIGFGAIERTGNDGLVIFSDISVDLIERCRQIAAKNQLRARFVISSADDLCDIADDSIDVLTTRSVLIYVERKVRAFAEFLRVLRPGGRVSIGEPINRFIHPEPRGRFCGYDVTPVVELADKLEAFFDLEERPKIGAMLDFDERDLVAMAERAGFVDLHLDYEADVRAPRATDWIRFVQSAGNPLSPTLEEAMNAALTPGERDGFTAHLKPLVESGTGVERRAFAFLTAKKPLSKL
jgi:arsenite methyltransferase